MHELRGMFQCKFNESVENEFKNNNTHLMLRLKFHLSQEHIVELTVEKTTKKFPFFNHINF